MKAKLRDRQLMIDTMKYGANIFYRDDIIAIVEPADARSFCYFAYRKPDDEYGQRYYSRHMDNASPENRIWVVQVYNGQRFGLTFHKRDNWSFADTTMEAFTVGDRSAKLDTQGVIFSRILAKYPQLYNAFADMAREHNLLQLLRDPTEENIMIAVRERPVDVRFVKKMSTELAKKIIMDVPEAFRHMKQTRELQEYAVRLNGGFALKDIPEANRTEALCRLALKNGITEYSFKMIPRRFLSEAFCLEAVRQNGHLLKVVPNPTIAIMKAAIKQTPDAWLYIKDEKLRKKLKKMK